MAKEIHGYIKTFIVVAAIIFAFGGYALKVNNNSHGVKTNRKGVSDNKDSVHKLQLADKDIVNMAEKSLTFMSQVNTKLESIQTTQAKQATVQAVNSEKLNTLTK